MGLQNRWKLARYGWYDRHIVDPIDFVPADTNQLGITVATMAINNP